MFDDLAFAIDERVAGLSGPTTSEKLRITAATQHWFETECPAEGRAFYERELRTMHVLNFICHSNHMEQCGYNHADDTIYALETAMQRGEHGGRQRQETLQTFDAMVFLSEEHRRNAADNRAPHVAAHDALLTESVVCETHRILMGNGLLQPASSAGHYRTGIAFTYMGLANGGSGGTHMYPAAAVVPNRMALLIDQYNALLLAGAAPSSGAEARLAWFARMAATLVLRLLTIHPFADGNGRLARQLCAFVMRATGTPFPSVIGGARSVYIDALVRCRTVLPGGISDDDGLAPPGALTALVVDGLWQGWRDLRQFVMDHLRVLNASGRGKLASLAAYDTLLSPPGPPLDDTERCEERHRIGEALSTTASGGRVVVPLSRGTTCIVVGPPFNHK